MFKNTKALVLLISIFICCAIMALTDGILMPPYAIKSAVKLILFIGVPVAWYKCMGEGRLRTLFIPDKKSIKLSLGLALPVFLVILGAYFLCGDIFDFSKVTSALVGNIGVTKNNFVFVALYISFVNSLVEEFFFRGFSYITLKKYISDKAASLISASFFALYHIAIMTGWFGAAVFVLSLSGLFAGGLIFNYLDKRGNNLYPSWFVHMFSNFAINIIGFILFGII